MTICSMLLNRVPRLKVACRDGCDGLYRKTALPTLLQNKEPQLKRQEKKGRPKSHDNLFYAVKIGCRDYLFVLFD